MKVHSLSNQVTAAPASVGGRRLNAGVQPPVAAEEQSPSVVSEQVHRAVEAINRQIQTVAPNLRFSIDEDAGHTVVRVVDTSTGDVIRQVPSEEVLAISASTERLRGLLFHQEV